MSAQPDNMWVYLIDIAGTCNLRCPACPVGNYPENDTMKRTRGFMTFKLYCEILDKIEQGRQAEKIAIELYNWGEPTLHQDLPDFISEAKRRGFYVNVSSNLNTTRDWAPILKSGLDDLIISTSGTTPNTYSRTHLRGDVDLVISNMHRISQVIKTENLPVQVFVNFITYKSNVHEFAEMQRLGEQLGFKVRLLAASLFPVEKMIAYYEGREPNPDDLEVMDNLLIPFSEMVSVWQGRQNNFCLMQERQTVIDFRGRVSLCCMTYGEHSIVSPSFLDDPFEATLEAKRRHPTCKSCMAFGAHNMIDYYEDEAMQRLLSGKIEAVLGPQKSTVA